MKKLRLFFGIAFTALMMSACQSNTYKVEGVAEGMEDGDTILIFKNAPAPVDTLIVKDGAFSWSGQADSVVCYFITAPKVGASTLFFAEPGTIHITLHAKGVPEVSGTKANDALQEMNVKQAEYRGKVDTLLSKLNTPDISEEQRKLVAADTIDKMQGQEREVIIYSLVSGNLDYMTEMAEFLYNPNKMNVAFSRAKSKLTT